MAAGFARTRSSLEGENPGIIAIAVDMGKNSNFAVKWAADNLMRKGGSSSCILVHVHNKPAPAQSQNGPSQKEVQQLFLPFRGFCARKGIEAQEVVLFDADIAKALLEYIAKNSIGTLVIGATNKSAFSRKFWSVSLSTTLIQAVPDSCSVYVISKGKVQSMRLANQPPPPLKSSPTPLMPYNQFPPPSPDQQSEVMSMSDFSYSQGSLRSEFSSDRLSIESSDSAAISSSTRTSANRGGGGGGYGRTPFVPPGAHHQGKMTSRLSGADSAGVSNFSDSSAASGSSLSSGGMPRNFQCVDTASYEGNNNNNSTEFSGLSASSTGSTNSSDSMHSMEAEIRRLKLELQQTLDAYHSICKDAATTNRMTTKPQNFNSHDYDPKDDSNMSLDLDISTPEIEVHRNRAARITQLLSEMETQKKQNAEMRANYKQALRERNHNSRSMESLAYYGNNPNSNIQFRKYNIQDIEMSTNHFAPAKKIGEGGYGPVYKGIIDEIPVAIKVVRPDLSQGQKQFQKEVEVLSTVRHPHMVNLLGACPQYGCLVYEYMDNGSLEDRLFRKDNTPTIPWPTRFKIASEIATGLLFLHEHKPEPIVHRDLKPANILLDSNYVSKIGDVGLARLVPGAAPNSNVTRYHVTAAAGTFCYIDPEYQQTGLLSVKSDLFSLGVVLLQLITGRAPMGLSYHVEEAVENGRFLTVLDPTVLDWPVEEAMSLAKLALQCCELRKKDRPSLGNVVLPELIRLRDFAAGRSLGFD
ncbi:unnamed protein product [Linum trigynum]|uniref:Protein kinase domain-containing protein n=1 Tax=Linum trigynum TaxID=586398 RepID=A0AAV2FN61_9ROSI